MELTNAVIAVLSPLEMKTLRKKHAGMTLETLFEQTGISVPQLSRFENGVNGLRLDQVKAAERVLLAAARERSQALSKLLAPENEMAEAKLMSANGAEQEEAELWI